MRTRVISGMALFILILGMAGCGGGSDGTPGSSNRKAVSALSLAAPDKTVGGIQLTLNMPAGVVPQPDQFDAAGNVVNSAVRLVGGSDVAVQNLQKKYTPDPATGGGKLEIVAIEPAGFTSNHSILITLDITGGIPKAADFTISNLIISDLNGLIPKDPPKPDFTVEII
jgi:hypothetical protein